MGCFPVDYLNRCGQPKTFILVLFLILDGRTMNTEVRNFAVLRSLKPNLVGKHPIARTVLQTHYPASELEHFSNK